MSETLKTAVISAFLYPLVVAVAPEPVLALTPPAYNELCKIVGVVTQIGTAEGTDERMNKVVVSTVVIRLIKIEPSGISEKSYVNCNTLEKGQEPTYRNCDDFSFRRGEKVQGIVGRSKGGGPICISNIKRIRK